MNLSPFDLQGLLILHICCQLYVEDDILWPVLTYLDCFLFLPIFPDLLPSHFIRLEKIKQLESTFLLGKAMNEEQQVLISSKAGVERSLVELEAIRTQLEEVAKDEEKRIADEQAAPVLAPVPAPAPEPEPEPEPTPTPAPAPVVEVVKVFHHVTEASPREVLKLLETPLKKILKALHVCARYDQTTGRVLPPTVDFFGKALLGMTSIRSFPETLDMSLRSAGYYLNVSWNRTVCPVIISLDGV
jgi:hypothetical protein